MVNHSIGKKLNIFQVHETLGKAPMYRENMILFLFKIEKKMWVFIMNDERSPKIDMRLLQPPT